MNASAPSSPVSTPSPCTSTRRPAAGSPSKRRRARVAEPEPLRMLEHRLDAIAQRVEVAADRRLVEADDLPRRDAEFARAPALVLQLGRRPARLGRDRREDLGPGGADCEHHGRGEHGPPPPLENGENDERAGERRAGAVNVNSNPTAAIAASGHHRRGAAAHGQSATTSMVAVPSGLRNVETSRRTGPARCLC